MDRPPSEERSLLEAIVRLAEERDLPRLLERGMDLAIDLTGAARGFLFLFQGESFDAVVARNLDRQRLDDPLVEFSRTVVRAIQDGGLPHIVADDIGEDPRFGDAESVRRLELRSVLATPVRAGGALVGAFYLDHPGKTGAFRHVSLETLELFSRFFAAGVERTREFERTRVERDRLRGVVSGRYRDLVGRSRKMEAVLARLEAYAGARDPVVLTGETGTGKGVVARILHAESPRRDGPFQTVNCANFSDELLETELFGHTDDAFTGARRARAGLVEVADGGTLFLDEIQLMSTRLQGTLLRFLEGGVYRRVGEPRERRADVRVVCATNVPPAELIADGRLQSDLYYRISVLSLELPPLRERREDVALLADHLSRRAAVEREAEPKTFSAEALSRLEAHGWPGNIRELENLVRKAYVVVKGTEVTASDVLDLLDAGRKTPAEDYGWGSNGALDRFLIDLAAQKAWEALEAAGGNKSAAARYLGVGRDRLRGLLGLPE